MAFVAVEADALAELALAAAAPDDDEALLAAVEAVVADPAALDALPAAAVAEVCAAEADVAAADWLPLAAAALACALVAAICAASLALEAVAASALAAKAAFVASTAACWASRTLSLMLPENSAYSSSLRDWASESFVTIPSRSPPSSRWIFARLVRIPLTDAETASSSVLMAWLSVWSP
ncbi:hypothetical protein B9P52_04560 [Achromobacter denitrificans]|uniref:hypothetical protein n=1 Tax=Achromobacter denitrificans TaxID=32002 RepID=UPI000B4D22D3|nr:hypothetical protein [Achromobacter denitrificans]ASC63609.1 hypothetical protein B9P52_04560 [Achromobacter denitrificans]